MLDECQALANPAFSSLEQMQTVILNKYQSQLKVGTFESGYQRRSSVNQMTIKSYKLLNQVLYIFLALGFRDLITKILLRCSQNFGSHILVENKITSPYLNASVKIKLRLRKSESSLRQGGTNFLCKQRLVSDLGTV